MSAQQKLEGAFLAQITANKEKETKTGKPFLELTFADATGDLTIKAWENHPQFPELKNLEKGSGLKVSGQFTSSKWGIDASPWASESLSLEEQKALFAGDTEKTTQQNHDYETITRLTSSLNDPRLRDLCAAFLAQFGDRFRRTAAARRNHHARRGGLVEHVAQMMRSADAICSVYSHLNRDLLLTGVLFHDCGKLWENNYPEEGFAQIHQITGELLGHIPLGMELLNHLWRDLKTDPERYSAWQELQPSPDRVRLHLLHLIASHHGTHEFGSPTLPRTPEAHALHYIDNLDAKLEMIADAYQEATELAPDIYERRFPLPANLVTPLPSIEREKEGAPSTETSHSSKDEEEFDFLGCS